MVKRQNPVRRRTNLRFDPFLGANHFGAERQESGEQKARRIIDEELVKLGLSLEQLRLRRSGHPAKARIARRLRRETTMSLKWVAQELGIGSWKYLSNMLSEQPTNSGQLAFTDPIEPAATTATA